MGITELGHVHGRSSRRPRSPDVRFDAVARGVGDSRRWHAQFPAGHLAQPEWFEPYDTNRITASLAYEGSLKARPLRVTAAWGSNREFNGFNGNNDGYLLEWDTAINRCWTMYGRTEV